jgi:hypothetical protein
MRGPDPEKKDARESGTGVHVLASGLSMSRDGDECLVIEPSLALASESAPGTTAL